MSRRDKLVARGVCQDWNYYMSSIGLENLFYIQLEHTDEQLQTIANSPFDWIPCADFRFRNINLIESSSLFWKDFGDIITSLHFDECFFGPTTLESDGVSTT